MYSCATITCQRRQNFRRSCAEYHRCRRRLKLSLKEVRPWESFLYIISFVIFIRAPPTELSLTSLLLSSHSEVKGEYLDKALLSYLEIRCWYMSRLATIITSTDPAGFFANVPFVVREQLVWISVLPHVPHAKVTSDDVHLLCIEVHVFHCLLSIAFFRRNARRKEVGESEFQRSRSRCTNFFLGSGTLLSVPFGRSFARREIQILLTDTSLHIVSFTSMFRCRYERGTNPNRRRKATLPRSCAK